MRRGWEERAGFSPQPCSAPSNCARGRQEAGLAASRAPVIGSCHWRGIQWIAPGTHSRYPRTLSLPPSSSSRGNFVGPPKPPRNSSGQEGGGPRARPRGKVWARAGGARGAPSRHSWQRRPRPSAAAGSQPRRRLLLPPPGSRGRSHSLGSSQAGSNSCTLAPLAATSGSGSAARIAGSSGWG